MKTLITTAIALILFTSTYSSAEELYSESFRTAPSAAIKKGSLVKQKDGETAFCVENTDVSKTVIIPFPLNIELFKGKKIKISAMIRGEDISKPEQKWYGGKLQIYVAYNDNKKKWHDSKIPSGTFDWKKISFEIVINPGVEKIDLNLGLQRSTGKIFFRDVKIETIEAKK